MPDPLPPSIFCPVLIGRDAQVAALARLLEQARAGQGQIALISGEAGIGKSRLVAEIRKLATTQSMNVVQGNCFEPDRMLPYAPLLDLLRTLPKESNLPPELVALVGGQRPPVEEDPEQYKRRSFAAFERILLAQPCQLIILEDLHWCDDTSLEFLFRFVRNLATAPICLLLTLRSDEVHPVLAHFLAELERRHLSTEIALPRFSERETQAVIRAIFAQQKVRAEFVVALQTLTDGNPFFVEETLKALVTTGAIYQAQGVWTRKPLQQLHIPRTVQDAVQRRTAQLSPAARNLLVTAAVAGQRFDFDLLQTVTGESEGVLLTLIKELTSAQLVSEGEVDHFSFRHALTRQAIYANCSGANGGTCTTPSCKHWKHAPSRIALLRPPWTPAWPTTPTLVNNGRNHSAMVAAPGSRPVPCLHCAPRRSTSPTRWRLPNISLPWPRPSRRRCYGGGRNATKRWASLT